MIRQALLPRTLLLALLVTCPGALTAAPERASAEVIDGVAAVVDNDVILLSEVDGAASAILSRIAAEQGTTELPAELIQQVRKQAVQQLIEVRLMRKYAERVNLDVTPEEIDETVAGIASDEGITPDDIYAAAAQQGLDRKAYREELGNQITQMKVMSGAVRSRIEISDEEIEALFKERYRDIKPGVRARVRQIFIPWPEPEENITRDQVRELAGEVRSRAIETGEFAALAQRFSRAPSAASGGLTTFREGEVSADVARWVFEPEPGSISPVIENAAGVSLFQVIGRFDPSEVQLADVEEGLRAELRDRRMEPEFNRWMEDQRKQFYIQIVSPELKLE